jgi:hypothetical protein
MEDLQDTAVFDDIYRDYLDQVSRINLEGIKDALGIAVQGQEVVVPLFGTAFRVSSQGIADPLGRRPSHSVSVVLCKYLLMCPEHEPTGTDWVAYRDFRDSGPFVHGFRANAEANISKTFSGRMAALERLSTEFAGRPSQDDYPGQLRMRFDALPRVPMLMLFNDEDEEFPSQCSLLFERRAQYYLDMECLAISGWILAEWLKQRL